MFMLWNFVIIMNVCMARPGEPQARSFRVFRAFLKVTLLQQCKLIHIVYQFVSGTTTSSTDLL